MVDEISTQHREAARPGLTSILGSIAATIAHPEFPSGDRAALRRMNPAIPPPLAFYRFAFRHLPETWDRQEGAWVTLVAGLSLMGPHAHRPGLAAGRALAEAGLSESRLERLLAADGDTMHALLLRLARFLGAKVQPLDWTDLAVLILSTDPAKREQSRLRIAREYYRSLRAKE